MRIRYFLPALVISTLHAEEGVNLASAEAYQMQLAFGPPPVITPQTDFTMPVENQFDYLHPWADASVAQDVGSVTSRPVLIGLQANPYSDGERALFRFRGSNAYVIGHAYRHNLNSYKDGNGKTVNAGYLRNGQAVVGGLVPDARQEYRLGVIHDRIDDDRQPHFQLDARSTRRIVLNGTARIGAQDQSNTFNFNVRHVDLERAADNHSLRRPAAGQPRVGMEIERQMTTLNADYRLHYGEQRSQFGLTYGHDQHLASRFVFTPQGKKRNAYRFPDIHSDRMHLFYDHFWDITPAHQLSGGLSYDLLRADPRAKNTPASIGNNTFPAPAQLWQKYYGRKLADKQKTDGFGIALSYRFQPSEQQSYRVSVDSLLRQPDNTERFHALPGENGSGWIGNPFLKPERHNRISLQGSWQGEGYRDYGKVAHGDLAGAWKIEAQADYDKVSNFITLDRARRQPGILQADNNVISRNVDATLIGAELSAAKSLTDNLAVRGKIRYQYGENDTDKRALYNVRPMSADIAVDYRDYAEFGSYNLGASLHYSHRNRRLDSDKKRGLGLDNPLNHQSYATVNLYAGLQTHDRFALTLGVNNLFDRQYYAFNEQPHIAAQSTLAVGAPERTYWLGFHFNF